jgi:hypothetical protein
MKAVARTGVASLVASDYLEKCQRYDQETLCGLLFARYHGTHQLVRGRIGYWVQLTLTPRAPSFEFVGLSPKMEEQWLFAFFGQDRPKVRTDLATTEFGRSKGIRHYRLFTDERYRDPYVPQLEYIYW